MLSKIAAFTAAACCSAVALAQTYPSKPVRLGVLPDVGTVAEQGYPGFETSQWYGLIGPAKLPDAIVNRLASESAKAAKSAALEKQLEPDSAEAVGSTPKEFAAYIATEQVRWKEVVQKAHVRVD